jgi:predicted O-methyltransferase YrrM
MAGDSLVGLLYGADGVDGHDPGFPHNPVLRELLERRAFEHDGRTFEIRHTMGRPICELMGDLIMRHGLRSGLEVGTLFGFATLYLAEAFARTGGVVDTVDMRPETMRWHDDETIVNVHEVAERLVLESGLSDHVRFLEGNSNLVLPRLLRQGRRYDIALIDGSHRFPTVLLDFLSVDGLLDDGGFVFMDDVGAGQAAKEDNLGSANRVLAHVFASGRYEVLPLSSNVAVCRKLVPAGGSADEGAPPHGTRGLRARLRRALSGRRRTGDSSA